MAIYNGTIRSGTITSGGTAQEAMPANETRRYLLVQNQSAGDLYIKFSGTATANHLSLRLASGAAYEAPAQFCFVGAISIIGATTGQAFYAVEG